ncbi:hypothetical protein BGZ99_006120 [Dissophora globulifera]|uniref:OPT superfamily oligopeptide transporter n=1 Tax=Dissophora globulifera TaxID=979702 RepID=A0A9P6RDE8_9FUNG|nr:hypothetical protein BGZ99_006120 [Dissophora globulifera]
MGDKYEYRALKTGYGDEKSTADPVELREDAEDEVENSRIEAVRLVVPVTDDPSLISVTFRFWVISLFFSVIGSVINQYYYFRTTTGSFSIFFVNLASYGLGKSMARVLPMKRVSLGFYAISLNPGPFNVKEHALIGIAVSTAAFSAYAIDILTAMDLFLHHRIDPFGALVLIITTQCLGYGMAGVLRKYLVYPAEMVWWPNLVQVVFYNAMHNTDEFRTKKMVRGWSYMKFFWVLCGVLFVYEFIPQFLAPIFIYFDWLCWINPFNMDFWAIFSSMTGGGVFSLSFDWTSIGGSTLYLPLAAQLCNYGGMVLMFWIIMPIMWLTNTLGTKTFGRPLTSHLYYSNGTDFNILEYLKADYSLNEDMYNAGPPAVMTPMYALGFFCSFIALAGCVSHVICFNGADLWRSWKMAIGDMDEDIHTKMMKVYPEMPQLWYAIFYLLMVALSIMVCEVYGLQLTWWGLIVACLMGWVLTLPICAMTAITGFGPGLNVITELICGYMLPGKPIANMTFKCYGYMAMYQCMSLLSDLKLGHYMKIPPRSMFVAQLWGAIIGGVFNYFTMIVIINSRRSYLDGTEQDPNGLWTGVSADTFWGSALIYGALGPKRMFSSQGNYGFVFYGLVIGAVIPVMQWGLSKRFPHVAWSKFNISIIAGGMTAFPNGYVVGVLPSIIVCVVFQFYLFRYHKGWWSKYTFILSAALDTGAAFTGLFIFLFLGGGISPKLSVSVPSWWANYYTPEGDNAPYLMVDRCGAAGGKWTGGTL